MSGRSKRAPSEQDAAEIADDSAGGLGEATSNVPERYRRSSSPEPVETREDDVQRAAIVGQLAGGVLHDFNNVLTVITGVIGLLADAVADKPQLAAMTKLIDEAAARGAALTSSLLAFGRGRPAYPCEVDVNALLVGATRLLRPALGGVDVAMMAVEGLSPALADPDQLLAAVLSLAVVARNAFSEGGKLSFETGTVRAEAGHAHPRDAEDRIMIALRAHGYGSLAEHPEQIFTDIVMAEDFVRKSGGRLRRCAPSGDFARVEILLQRAQPSVRWLADD
jgi:signal transduction histidine kinase